MNEKLLKPEIIKILQKLENKEKFLYFKVKDESSSTNADNSNGKSTNIDDKGINTDSKDADKGKDASIDNKDEDIYDSYGLYNTKEED
ncbi:hypothetical protein RclHR1_05380007 [Rhizophagus clarus]|uniref:Uncharacterized protein n=1 Tax=Rhizophagus clarus TaxID=94130 RepID=A0A2Z6S431_9GLOM|nr:hypothetical protein RclHR1_05380007 [Rhizophagus clarus]